MISCSFLKKATMNTTKEEAVCFLTSCQGILDD